LIEEGHGKTDLFFVLSTFDQLIQENQAFVIVVHGIIHDVLEVVEFELEMAEIALYRLC
jgi:hypothetical protein